MLFAKTINESLSLSPRTEIYTKKPEPNTLDFGFCLLRKGNRESTVQRKLKYLRQLKGSPEEMVQQILGKLWKDKTKSNALDCVVQYAEFLGEPIEKPNFRVYQNEEMYVPNHQMVRQFVYRIRKLELRTAIEIAIETGASVQEVHNLKW